MSGHTPGPWHVKTAVSGPDLDRGIYADGHACVLAECFEEFEARGVRKPEEALANARLIAAAPTQNAALRDALDALTAAEQYHARRCAKDAAHDHELLRRLQAAIINAEAALALAEGR